MNTTRKDFILNSMLAATALSSGLGAYSKSVKHEDLVSGNKITDKATGKICIFSKHLQWLEYEGMAATAFMLGFDGIDLTVRPNGHVSPERVADDLPKAVEAVRKKGLEVYMLTTEIIDADHPHTENILKTARQLGIGYYRTGRLSYKDNITIPQNLEAFKSTLEKLAVLNKRYSIHGDYQNHAGTGFGASGWDLWMVLKDMDPQWIGCQYDIRHATVEGANSWPLALKLLQSHIRTIDVKDFHWIRNKDKWEIENVPLGEGLVNFKKYFQLIRQYKINGPISLHFEYPLGGAGEGSKTLSIEKEKVIEAMRKDLTTLRTWLKD